MWITIAKYAVKIALFAVEHREDVIAIVHDVADAKAALKSSAK